MNKLKLQLLSTVISYCVVGGVSVCAAAEAPAASVTADAPGPAGVGLLLTLDKPGHFVVQYVLPDMPASKANLQIGDVVLAVDGVAVNNLKTVEELVDKIRGASGSSVKLKIQSGEKNRDIVLVRGAIPTVKSQATDMDFGRQVSVYFYLHDDLIPEDEPGKYVFMGNHSVAQFLRQRLNQRGDY